MSNIAQLRFLFVLSLLMGLLACNNSTETKSEGSDTSKTSLSTDTMAHMGDSTLMGNAQPAVPAGAKVFFKNLKEGQKVMSPLKVEMGVEGMKLDTAGVVVAGAGHHHLLVDAGDSIPAGQMVPKDSTHLHFGKAQSSTEITLSPGKHRLTLQYADGIHRSYGSQLAASVDIEVKK